MFFFFIENTMNTTYSILRVEQGKTLPTLDSVIDLINLLRLDVKYDPTIATAPLFVPQKSNMLNIIAILSDLTGLCSSILQHKEEETRRIRDILFSSNIVERLCNVRRITVDKFTMVMIDMCLENYALIHAQHIPDHIDTLFNLYFLANANDSNAILKDLQMIDNDVLNKSKAYNAFIAMAPSEIAQTKDMKRLMKTFSLLMLLISKHDVGDCMIGLCLAEALKKIDMIKNCDRTTYAYCVAFIKRAIDDPAIKLSQPSLYNACVEKITTNEEIDSSMGYMPIV